MININAFTVWQSALAESWSRVWNSFLTIVPTIVGAIILFIIGLLIATWVKRLVGGLLRFLNLEKFTKNSGIDKYLKRAEIELGLIDLISTLAQWLVIVVFFLAVVDVLGLAVVSKVLVTILSYLPNVIAAALIIVAGNILASVVDGLVRGAITSIDQEIAKPIGKVARWLVLVIAIFAAIDQLQIAKGLIQTFFQGLTYTIVLAVGLSVGLGAKDLVSRILNDWYQKIKK